MQHSAESRHTDPLRTITSRTHDCQDTPRAISFSAAHVHKVRAPGPEDKACPSNLPVSKDAPAQSQHTHAGGASQPTTTLRSGELSVFHTTHCQSHLSCCIHVLIVNVIYICAKMDECDICLTKFQSHSTKITYCICSKGYHMKCITLCPDYTQKLTEEMNNW